MIISVTASAERLLRRLAPRSSAIYEELEVTFGKARMKELLDPLEDLADLYARTFGVAAWRG